MRLALAAIALACVLDVSLGSQPPESAMGISRNPFEQPVAMTGSAEAFVLATGLVDAAEHEAQDGFFAVQHVSLSVPRAGIPADILRQLRGRQVELVLRVVEPRSLRKVER